MPTEDSFRHHLRQSIDGSECIDQLWSLLYLLDLDDIKALLHQQVNRANADMLRGFALCHLDISKLLDSNLWKCILSFLNVGQARAVCRRFDNLQRAHAVRQWKLQKQFACTQMQITDWKSRNCYLLHTRRSNLDENQCQDKIRRRVLNTKQEVGMNAQYGDLILWDHDHCAIRAGDVQGWADHKIICGLSRSVLTDPMLNMGVDKCVHIELHAVHIAITNAICFYGKCLLSACTITAEKAFGIAADGELQMRNCTVHRSVNKCSPYRESYTAILVEHCAKSVVLESNVFEHMDHIVKMLPDPDVDCSKQCMSNLIRIQMVDNEIVDLFGQYAVIGGNLSECANVLREEKLYMRNNCIRWKSLSEHSVVLEKALNWVDNTCFVMELEDRAVQESKQNHWVCSYKM